MLHFKASASAGTAGLEFKGTTVGPGRGIKDVDTRRGIICGYWSTFNVADDGQVPDVVMPGAFKKTIQEQGPQGTNRIKFLWQHDADKILGVPQVLKEDNVGLYFESQIVPTSFGSDVLLLYEAGAINEHSIGYVPKDTAYDRSTGVRYLKQIMLYEGSACAWGLNPITPVTAIKGVGPERLAAHVGRLESVLRNGRLRDQKMAAFLEQEVKAGQRRLKESRLWGLRLKAAMTTDAAEARQLLLEALILAAELAG
jgi:HK97 family phage prohead protease